MAKQPFPGAPAASKHLCEETVMDDRAGTPKEAEWVGPGREHSVFGKDPKTSWIQDDAITTSEKED